MAARTIQDLFIHALSDVYRRGTTTNEGLP
jgi:hypothetical protein